MVKKTQEVEQVEDTLNAEVEAEMHHENSLDELELSSENEKEVSTEAEKVTLVKMVRDDGLEADVHPLEVENYKAGNWKVAE